MTYNIKVAKRQGFTLSLEDTFLEKENAGGNQIYSQVSLELSLIYQKKSFLVCIENVFSEAGILKYGITQGFILRFYLFFSLTCK